MNNDDAKLKKIADALLKRAYSLRGRIPYYYMDDYHLTPDERKQVNDELRKYGTLEDELFGQWEWFQLNEKGIAFVESGGFKEEDLEKKRKRWSHWSVVLAAVASALLLLKEIWPYLICFLERISEN